MSLSRLTRVFSVNAMRTLLAAGIEPVEARTSVRVMVEEAQRLAKAAPAGTGSSDAGLDKVEATLQDWLGRRAAREPLQYIVGSWPWSCVDLAVRRPVLIPRPETEDMPRIVKDIATDMKGQGRQGLRLLDVGTGTGAIAIACRASLPWLAKVDAIDVSPHAVQLARDNVARNGLRPEDVLIHQCPFQDFSPSYRFDILVSNPPYLPLLPEQPEVARWEDRGALLGGEPAGAGLVLDLLYHSIRLCNAGASILLEVHESHPAAIRALLEPQAAVQPLQLLPASGLGGPIEEPGAMPQWVQDRDDAWMHTIRGALSFRSAYYDCFGRPRFVHLKRQPEGSQAPAVV